MHEQNFNGTKKLYYEDSMMMEFDSIVLSSFSIKNSDLEKLAASFPEATYAIELKETAFFPEGGGQAGDEGILFLASDGDDVNPNAIKVLYTVEKDGIIYHLTSEKLSPGEKVSGRIDKKLRIDRMRQHTGEHIVSGLVHKRYGYENVGFHLGTEVTTLDFNGMLTPQQVKEIELLANEAVYENIKVNTYFYTKEETAKIEYRSKIDIEGEIRLVEIPGVDMCACCAPHTKTTGEVGLIKITDAVSYKGGIRLSILCGNRALKDYTANEEVTKYISMKLSVPKDEAKVAVESALGESENRRQEIIKWQEKYLLSSSINEEFAGDGLLLRFEEEIDTDIARKYVNTRLENDDIKLAGIFIGSEETGYRHIIGSKEIDLRALSKSLNEALDGKGGGKPEMIQGSVTAGKERIIEFFKSI